MKIIWMEKHRNRLPQEVQSLHHGNNGEGRDHAVMRPKEPPSTVIQ